MAPLERLVSDLAAGSISRRQFLAGAASLGLSAHVAAAIASDPQAALAQSATLPGPAADTVTFAAFNVDQAPLNIQNGDMDMYIFGLKTSGAKSLEGDDTVRIIEAPASTVSLILNPAPANDGELNPFSIVEVRRAMQSLVDRDFIANDIYQGRALPMLTSVSPVDYDQLTVFPVVSSANIRYDAEFAKQQIATAMQGAGATLDGEGFWSFNGKPIQLTIITRVEDERRDIGDLVRSALEGAGFRVQPQYQQFGPATLTVYATDPKAFQWHIYTEGWGSGGVSRYDDASINSFAAPWLGNMPGWQEIGFWQYENETLDTLGQQLYRGQFASREERDDLFRQMAQIAIDESVRIWLVTALQSFPVRADVENLTEDLVSGPKNLFALRGANIPGRTDIKVGHLWVWTERTTWNPVGGFGDVYSSDIARNLYDGTIIQHPFSGLPQPFRSDYTIETAGPDGTLEVPADAVRWDAAADAWVAVDASTTAVSKVTWDLTKLFASPWHHGQPISMADVVYGIAQSYELAYDEAKIQIETALGITSRPLLETYKGYRVTGPATIEVYADYWHFEEGYIASYASVGAQTPWEVLAAMDAVVFENRQGAYTNTAAARFNVPWISLVTESDARLVLRQMRQFKSKKTIPAGVFSIGGQELVDEASAVARYEACDEWFDTTNHLIIGNGPFSLTRYDPPAQFAQIDAVRAEGYPFTADDFRLGTPPRVAIAPIEAPAFALGEPVSISVGITGPGALQVQYSLIDPAAGTVVASGAATSSDGATFAVDVDPVATAALFPGIYTLHVLASSDEIAQVAQQRVDVSIGL